MSGIQTVLNSKVARCFEKARQVSQGSFIELDWFLLSSCAVKHLQKERKAPTSTRKRRRLVTQLCRFTTLKKKNA
jgi:hypothetical protein